MTDFTNQLSFSAYFYDVDGNFLARVADNSFNSLVSELFNIAYRQDCEMVIHTEDNRVFSFIIIKQPTDDNLHIYNAKNYLRTDRRFLAYKWIKDIIMTPIEPTNSTLYDVVKALYSEDNVRGFLIDFANYMEENDGN